MRIHRFIRSMAAASALALILATGIAAKKEAPLPPAKPIRVAIMPVVNSSADVGAPKIMEDILHDRLKEIPADRATFLQPTDTERLLEARNASDKIYSLNDKWSKFGTLDSAAVDGIDSLLTADAILFVKVAEWENVRVNQIGHGESNTTVGLQFALSILVFVYAGQWLDRKLGTTPWLLLAGVFVGGAGSFYSMYRKLMAAQEREEKARKARREGMPE